MKIFEKKLKTYIKETDKINEKYFIDKNDVENIKNLCQKDLPEIKLKDSERIEYCTNQKRLADRLLSKLLGQLKALNLYSDSCYGKFALYSNEEYGRVNCIGIEEQRIFEPYFNRSKEGKNLIYELIMKTFSIKKFFHKEIEILNERDKGNNSVKEYFSMFSDKYPCLYNIILPNQNKQNLLEINSIIVTPKGVFVCKIKNFNKDETIYINEDDSWCLTKWNHKEKHENSFEENTYNMILLEKYLRQNGIDCKVIPMIVVSNNETKIVNRNKRPVIKSASVYEYIENLSISKTIDEETQEQIVELLGKLENEEKLFAYQNLEAVYKEYEDAIEKAFEIRTTEIKLEEELLAKCQNIIEAYNKRYNFILILVSIVAFILAAIFVILHIKGIIILIGIGIVGSIFAWLNK